MKLKTQYACQQCGYIAARWIGRCPSCGQWNTLVEEVVEKTLTATSREFSSDSTPIPFDRISMTEIARTPTGIAEFDRVLGGGVVPGALILLGGDPGVGKSTLMLDAAVRLAAHGPVLYASGEESVRQIRLRGDRLGVDAAQLHVYGEMCIENILAAAENLKAQVLVVDSIQTTFTNRVEMAPGSIGQVREVAAQLLFWSKKHAIPVFLIGHITKDGAIAGPKALEHIVDTVLYFEGPRQSPHRIVRTIKNRFGAANEIGIFEMVATGLRPVERASGLFLSQNSVLGPGSAVHCCIEGSRPLLVEIQALVSRTHFGAPRRLATGVDPQRLALLAAVLEKRLGTNLWEQDIYLNVVGGLEVEEPAADLAIITAILSSLLNKPAAASAVLIGEVGLAGEVRPVLSLETRLKEAAALGFTNAMVPDQPLSEPAPAGLSVRRVTDLHKLIDQF